MGIKDSLGIGAAGGAGGMAQLEMLKAQAAVKKVENIAKGAEGKAETAKAGEMSDAQRAEVEQAATQFEALLVNQMVKSMWSTVPKGGLLSGSREEELYRDMLNQSLSEEIAKGQGVGIKEVIMRELNHHNHDK